MRTSRTGLSQIRPPGAIVAVHRDCASLTSTFMFTLVVPIQTELPTLLGASREDTAWSSRYLARGGDLHAYRRRLSDSMASAHRLRSSPCSSSFVIARCRSASSRDRREPPGVPVVRSIASARVLHARACRVALLSARASTALTASRTLRTPLASAFLSPSVACFLLLIGRERAARIVYLHLVALLSSPPHIILSHLTIIYSLPPTPASSPPMCIYHPTLLTFAYHRPCCSPARVHRLGFALFSSNIIFPILNFSSSATSLSRFTAPIYPAT